MLKIKDLIGKTDVELKDILKRVIFYGKEELDWTEIFSKYIQISDFSVNSRDKLGREIYELLCEISIEYNYKRNKSIFSMYGYDDFINYDNLMRGLTKIDPEKVREYVMKKNGLISNKNFFKHVFIKILREYISEENMKVFLKIERNLNDICIKLGYYGDLLHPELFNSNSNNNKFKNIEYIIENYAIKDKNKINKILEIVFDIIKIAITPIDEVNLDEVTDFFSDVSEEEKELDIDNELL